MEKHLVDVNCYRNAQLLITTVPHPCWELCLAMVILRCEFFFIWFRESSKSNLQMSFIFGSIFTGYSGWFFISHSQARTTKFWSVLILCELWSFCRSFLQKRVSHCWPSTNPQSLMGKRMPVCCLDPPPLMCRDQDFSLGAPKTSGSHDWPGGMEIGILWTLSPVWEVVLTFGLADLPRVLGLESLVALISRCVACESLTLGICSSSI